MTVLGTAVAAAPVGTSVPVEPDAGTARRWAEQELSDPIYHEPEQTLLDRVIGWILERFDELGDATSRVDGPTAAILVAVVVLVVGVIAFLVAGPVRRARAARRRSTDVFGDDTRTADELRASADRLAADGRWSEAVLDRFRAILRSLEERVVLDERPGRTAHEASEEAGVRLPSCADDLRRAGVLFDDVCYGDAEASADDDAWLRELDRRVAETRPALPATAGPVDPEDPDDPSRTSSDAAVVA